MSATPHASPAALLQLIWLASPALPIGGFSYSEGLEAAIEAGAVHDEATAADWLRQQLHISVSRSELPALRAAWQAWQDGDLAAVRATNAWVLHTRESAELRLQTEQMGRSLVQWLRNHHAGNEPALSQVEALAAMDPSYPCAYALALVHSGAALPDGMLAFAFAWAEAMVQAALKAMPLGQSAGQRVLAALAAAIPAAVAQALAQPLHQRQSFAPRLAILSARHETQYSRLFRS